jgi:hypothetical protein
MPKKINLQWFLGIVAAVFIAGTISLFTYIFGGWGTVFSWLKSFWGILIYQVSVPVWFLSILIIISLGSLIIFFIAWLKFQTKPSWLKYTEDIFDEIVWRWAYSKNSPKNICPFCIKRRY